jgi:hypothetical protein
MLYWLYPELGLYTPVPTKKQVDILDILELDILEQFGSGFRAKRKSAQGKASGLLQHLWAPA